MGTKHSPPRPARSPSTARLAPCLAGPLFTLALAASAVWPGRAGATPSAKVTETARAKTSTATIDLNSASAETLATLPGIGPRRARAIVERRTKRRFRTVEELGAVRGFGPKLVRRLRPHVVARP